MAGFTGGIARGKTKPLGPEGAPMPANLPADRPWEYDFVGEEDPGLGNIGGAQRSNGPKGNGFYVFHSPAENALRAQQHFTNQFKQDMPNLRNKMFEQFSDVANSSMGENLGAVNAGDSSRGLLYGGVHAANEGAVRADAGAKLAGAKSDINKGITDQYNKMASNTIASGVQYQQQMQAQQDAIYEEAMRRFSQSNSFGRTIGGVAGALAGAYFGAGNPYAVAGGYQAGSQAGGALV